MICATPSPASSPNYPTPRSLSPSPPSASAPVTPDEARALTAAAGGIESLSRSVALFKALARDHGLDPEEHISTDGGYVLLSPDLGGLVAGRTNELAERR
ncbi:uncharacterized protein LOC62_01G001568 [Vanrija pseudolonga]|uniref:Uncharacterized protein n=1 Tax=Vanrija pseudolonga TaxID=143232 RepID=A0AAF1BJ70_9TREE|nr:hypothetical protein LOC62_01G001568 [Vanrija pseudolonga]